MLRHYILLLLCFSCTLWALTLLLNRNKNTISQNIWMILMLLIAGSTYLWMVFLGACFTPVEFLDLTSFLMAVTGLVFFFLGYTIYNKTNSSYSSNSAASVSKPPDIVNCNTATNGDYSSILFRFNLLIEQEVYLKKNLRAEDVAIMIHTNRTYISKLLKEEFECTFTDFINRKRIEYARKLMHENPRLSQEEIADKSGFTHTSSFSRIFKQYTGTTFRQAQKNNLSQSPRR